MESPSLEETHRLVAAGAAAPAEVLAEAGRRRLSRDTPGGRAPGLLELDALWRGWAATEPDRFPDWACPELPGIVLAYGFALQSGAGVSDACLRPAEHSSLEEILASLQQLTGVRLVLSRLVVVNDDSVLGLMLAEFGAAVAYAPVQHPALRRDVLMDARWLDSRREKSMSETIAEDIAHELLHGAIAELAAPGRLLLREHELAEPFEEQAVRLLVAWASTVAAGVDVDEARLHELGEIFDAETVAELTGDASPQRARWLLELAVDVVRSADATAAACVLNDRAARLLSWNEWLRLLGG